MATESRREISSQGKERIEKAWQKCLDNPRQPGPKAPEGIRVSFVATAIHDTVLEEVNAQLERAGIHLDRGNRCRLSMEIAACVGSAFEGERDNSEKLCLMVEEKLLNSWPFGEIPGEIGAPATPEPRQLRKETRSRIFDLLAKKSYAEAKEEILEILARVITEEHYVENRCDDEEIQEIVANLADRWNFLEADEFLDEFERLVLNHPGLKTSASSGIAPPVQEELF